MTWCNDSNDVVQTLAEKNDTTLSFSSKSCPSCGHQIKCQPQGRINDLPGLPAGVRFDPTDQELIQHLEGKVKARRPEDDVSESSSSSSSSLGLLHPLIDEFIPSLEGENGICYTHPEKLPGVNKDGQVRHFFHRPSKAYTTGTRKRRKVHTEEDGSETRWHKTGKTRPVLINGRVRGYKKILVLYTNYGKQKKPEKTNWVMHQYHLGIDEEEKDGELVVSKVFFQTQPRQCGSILKTNGRNSNHLSPRHETGEYYNNSSIISFEQRGNNTKGSNASTVSMFPFCCP